MSHILITGISGTIGTGIAMYLRDKYSIVGMYRQHRPFCFNGTNIKLIQCDLTTDDLPDLDIDTVIHMAGTVNEGRTEEFVHNNIIATEKLLDYISAHKIRKLIYASSYCIFGQVEGVLTENSHRIDPDVYAMSKYIGELMIEEADIPQKIILRLPRVFSEYQNVNREITGLGGAVNKLYHNAPVYCNMKVNAYNLYMTLDNLVEFINLQMIRAEENFYETVNLGASQQLSLLEIMKCIREGMESSSEIIPDYDGVRPRCENVDLTKAYAMGLRRCDEREKLIEFGKKLRQLQLR